MEDLLDNWTEYKQVLNEAEQGSEDATTNQQMEIGVDAMIFLFF